MSIYDRIGGGMAVSAAVDRFYGRVFADPAVSGRFDGVALHHLAGRQRAFLTAALGGPDFLGAGASARDAAVGMDDTVADHLAATLVEFGVPADTVAEVVRRLRAGVGEPAGAPVASPVEAFSVPELPAPLPPVAVAPVR